MPQSLRIFALVSLVALVGCGGESTPTPDAGAGPEGDVGYLSDMADLQVDAGQVADDGTEDAGMADGSMPDASMPDAPMPDGGSTDAGNNADMGAPPVAPYEDPNQLVTDRHFARGFVALDPTQGAIVEVGTLIPGFEPGLPVWQLGQWGSHSSLHAATPVVLPSGAVRWEDVYGAVTIGPEGSVDADLSLRVNAYTEYGGVYRQPNATVTWPHLLAEQRFSPPNNPGVDCPPISELESLDFSLDARLLFHDQHLQAGYDSSRHAADYLMFFTVQNLGDPASPGYGDFLWFGVQPFADREAIPGLYVAGDDFSGKLIYNIGLAPLSNVSLNDGQWHALSEDLLPHIKLALQEAWSRGYLSGSNDFADYRIGGMNLGWEIPGLNDAELQIRDLSLTATGVRYDFDTDGDAEGWTTRDVTDVNNGPLGGRWHLNVPGSDPALSSPPIQVDAAAYSSVFVAMANDQNPAAGARMQVFWTTAQSPAFNEANSAWIDVSNDGTFAPYSVDLSAHPGWTGTITQIRVDPIMYGDGHTVSIDMIALAL